MLNSHSFIHPFIRRSIMPSLLVSMPSMRQTAAQGPLLNQDAVPDFYGRDILASNSGRPIIVVSIVDCLVSKQSCLRCRKKSTSSSCRRRRRTWGKWYA